MAYDTIKLKSPSMDTFLVRQIEQKCILRSGMDMDSGELIYELYTGSLLGSWDSRISVIPKYEDWVTDRKGRPALHACEPYLLVEASVHKAMVGHNLYGGSCNFDDSSRFLVMLVQRLLDVILPNYKDWTVHRVDVAYMYRLSKPACAQFFDTMQLVSFPRRGKKTSKYAMAMHFAGKTTTVKFYHKGSEFKAHEYSRLRQFFKLQFQTEFGDDPKNPDRVQRKLDALQRLADNRLRVEVGINSDKLQYDFGKNPRVSEVNDAYLEHLHDNEIERVLREGKLGMDTVRTTEAVCSRLHFHYGRTVGNRLFGFWQSMCTSGTERTRARYSKSAFYRNRTQLENVGVSWLHSDIVIVANDSLIHDFTPQRVDRRLCFGAVRKRFDEAQNTDLFQLTGT